MDNLEKFFLGFVLVLCLAFVVMLAWIPYGIHIEKVCLENGFSSSKSGFFTNSYCITTIEQTDYVCSLDDVLNNSCDFVSPNDDVLTITPTLTLTVTPTFTNTPTNTPTKTPSATPSITPTLTNISIP